MEAVEPTVRTDILPGLALTVDPVEAGVYRVINDGLRDMASTYNEDIVVGHDGGIWVVRRSRFFSLGSDEPRKWPPKFKAADRVLEVTADGAGWVIRKGVIREFDGERWTLPERPSAAVVDVEVAPGGTVWTMWETEDGVAVGSLGPDGWESLEGRTDATSPTRLFITGADDMWMQTEGEANVVLHRYQDGAWQPYGPPTGAVAIGSDGTVWLVRPEPSLEPQDKPTTDSFADAAETTLGRFDGKEWDWWRSDDMPDFELGLSQDRHIDVAPDGSLWAGLVSAEGDEAVCDGVARFDGHGLDHYLRGHCVTAVDIAADGSVWLLARGADEAGDLVEPYVITPSTAAAAG